VPGAGDEPFAGCEDAPVVGLDAVDQRKSRGEFVRAPREPHEQAVRDRAGRSGCAGPEAPLLRRRRGAERRFSVAAQHRGERALVAGGDAHPVERRRHALPPGLALGAGLAVTGEGGVLALDPGKFRARRGKCAPGLVPRDLQGALARLIIRKLAAQPSDLLRRLLDSLAGGNYVGFGVARALEFGPGAREAGGLGLDPGEAAFRLFDRRLGDAPLGLDPGLIGGRLGEREFGGAAGAFLVLGLRGEPGTRRLCRCKPRTAGGEFVAQARQRLDRRRGQPVGIGAVLLQPPLLAGEIGEAGLGGFELFRKRSHAVPVRRGIVAPVGEFVARLGESSHCRCLLGLQHLHRLLRLGDPRLRTLGRCARHLRRRRRVAPAGEQQPRLGRLNAVREVGVAFRLLGLPPQRGDLRVLPGHEVLKPGEVGFRGAQLALGIAAAYVQARDPRRLLEHGAALGGPCGDDLRDLALADERGGMGAGRRVREGQGDVLCAHVPAVDAVGRTGAPLYPAGDDQLFAGVILGVEHHLGEVARRTGGGARKDHVLHPPRPHRLGRGFPHDPAYRFEKVGLAAAIGADDAGQPGFDAQFGRLDEALEPAELEPMDQHLCAASHPRAPQRAPARWSWGSITSQVVPSSFLPLRKKVGVPTIWSFWAWASVFLTSASILAASDRQARPWSALRPRAAKNSRRPVASAIAANRWPTGSCPAASTA
jgi:hypothetical protein